MIRSAISRIFTILYFTGILLLSLLTDTKAQDAHFSQFYSAPLLLNPALAGTIDGTFRISTVYRDQWRSALEQPLKTYTFSGDTKFEIGQTSKQSDIVGIGMTIYADRAGLFNLNTTTVTLTGAYHKGISAKNNSYLSLGFQTGISQRSIGYEELSFGDQFNAIDGYTLNTLEELPPNNYGIADFSIGLLYATTPSKDMSFNIGGGYFHFNQPNISFYSKDDNVNPALIKENTLKAKLSLHTSMSYSTSEGIRWNPRIMYLQQGQHNEANVGLGIRFQPNPGKAQAIHFGPWLRGTNNVNGFGVESVILMAGFEVNNWIFGMSYDQNLGDLSGTRYGLNTFEVSITYIGEHDNNIGWCPEF